MDILNSKQFIKWCDYYKDYLEKIYQIIQREDYKNYFDIDYTEFIVFFYVQSSGYLDEFI